MLLRAYYGTAPAKSYFEGGSTGGRQALILAQRFPNDFDGITAGAPVLNFTGTMLLFVQVAKALKDPPIVADKLPTLAAKVYEKCDAVDGIKDGIIDDPRKCDFQPARDLPQCEAGADRPNCFTAAQFAALVKIYAEVKSHGTTVFPNWPLSSEGLAANGHSGWDPWTIREGQPSLGMFFGEGFFRYLAPPKPDPNYDILSFDLEKDLPKLDTIHQILDATDTDLSKFRDRGGRLFMYFGWADPALNPNMGIDYYESVTKRMGPATTDFFGCALGVGQKGAAPDAVPVAKTAAGKVIRSRVLCAWPQVAKGKGSGSTDEAANFTCVKP